jgi:hypothetical protein
MRLGVMRCRHFVEIILLLMRNRMHLFPECIDSLDPSASKLGCSLKPLF